jgi:ABC-type molybdate transport system substrate-binding protein
MRKSLFNAAVKAFLIVLLQGIVAEAAEVKVLCSSASAIVPVMNEFVPQFERTTGHKVAIRYEFGPVLNREIEAGAVFDVAILSLDVEGLIKRGKIAAGTRAVSVEPLSVLACVRARRDQTSARPKHSSERCSAPSQSPIQGTAAAVAISSICLNV